MRRAWIALQRWYWMGRAWEQARYLKRCECDGLTDSLSLREYRGQLAEFEIRIWDLTPTTVGRARAFNP